MQVKFSSASKYADTLVIKWLELCKRASMRTLVMLGQNLNAKRKQNASKYAMAYVENKRCDVN